MSFKSLVNSCPFEVKMVSLQYRHENSNGNKHITRAVEKLQRIFYRKSAFYNKNLRSISGSISFKTI